MAKLFCGKRSRLGIIGCCVFSAAAFGQEQNANKTYEIEGNTIRIRHILIPGDGGVATSLDRINNEVDLSRYPDAEIHIRVDAVELQRGHSIRICKSCYGSEPEIGPNYSVNLINRVKGEHGSIMFGPLKNISGQITLKVDVQLYKGSTRVGREIHSSYRFTMKGTDDGRSKKVRARGNTDEIAPPATNEAIGFSNDLEEKIKEANDYWAARYLEGEGTYNRVSNQGDIAALRRHRDRYKSYLQNFKGLNPERDAHAERMLTQIIDRIISLAKKELPSQETFMASYLPVKSEELYEVDFRGNEGEEVTAAVADASVCTVIGRTRSVDKVFLVEIKQPQRPCRVNLSLTFGLQKSIVIPATQNPTRESEEDEVPLPPTPQRDSISVDISTDTASGAPVLGGLLLKILFGLGVVAAVLYGVYRYTKI
ncbi:hypothetical protein [Lewinella sp. W8]|uniref:hypothetical protein n=1 Tax=Lewinella sp. W8 TaxID=2528208 RepID=UPI001068916F|nr:hypothetical protein [Lewinella sp. W8]MTB52927.1 hypothetical protein [Lewinella sp. W8]